jgi:hypothetical protein
MFCEKVLLHKCEYNGNLMDTDTVNDLDSERAAWQHNVFVSLASNSLKSPPWGGGGGGFKLKVPWAVEIPRWSLHLQEQDLHHYH